MIGRVKQWLGIEGVKLELVLPEEIDARAQQVNGRLRFQSMNTQKVTWVKIIFIEKYTRGRGNDKRIDEYELGNLEVTREFEIPEGQVVEVPFVMGFSMIRSEIDEMERNFFLKGIAKTAKLLNKVHSEFRIEAEAKVKGTALNPFDRKVVTVK